MGDQVKIEAIVGLGPGVGADELDEVTRDLVLELRDRGVSASLQTDPDGLPSLAKGAEAVTIGTIVLAALPLALPKLMDTLRAWIDRSARRSLTVRIVTNGTPTEYHLDGKGLEGADLARAFERVMTSGSGSGQPKS